MNYFNLNSDYTKITRGRFLGKQQLFESYHILDSNEQTGYYKEKLKEIYNNAINVFMQQNNSKLIQVFKDINEPLFYKENFNITLPTNFIIQVFIAYDELKIAGQNGFSVINHDFDNLVKSNIKLYSDKNQLIYSIFLTIDDIYNPYNLGILYHEFMHVFQAIKSDVLKQNMSYGYSIAENILNNHMILMNDIHLQLAISNGIKTINELKGLLAACCYYCEYSERAAYIQSIINFIKAEKELYNISDVQKLLKEQSIYKIYKSIYQFTNNYLENKYDFNEQFIEYINDLLNDYKNKINLKSECRYLSINPNWINNINQQNQVKRIMKIWNKGALKFLKLANKIIQKFL